MRYIRRFNTTAEFTAYAPNMLKPGIIFDKESNKVMWAGVVDTVEFDYLVFDKNTTYASGMGAYMEELRVKSYELTSEYVGTPVDLTLFTHDHQGSVALCVLDTTKTDDYNLTELSGKEYTAFRTGAGYTYLGQYAIMQSNTTYDEETGEHSGGAFSLGNKITSAATFDSNSSSVCTYTYQDWSGATTTYRVLEIEAVWKRDEDDAIIITQNFGAE